MNFSSNTQLARERTRELRAPRAPRPSHDRTHGLIGRLLAPRAR